MNEINDIEKKPDTMSVIAQMLESNRVLTEKLFEFIQETKTEMIERHKNLSIEIDDKILAATGGIKSQVEKISYVQRPKHDFINKGDLGRMFTPNIGSHHISLLLKIVGLAQKSKGKVVPYFEKIQDGFAQPATYRTPSGYDVVDYIWHYEKTVNFILRWLEKKGLKENFLSCKTEDDVRDFIKTLQKG